VKASRRAPADRVRPASPDRLADFLPGVAVDSEMGIVHRAKSAWRAAVAPALASITVVHAIAVARAESPVDYVTQVKPLLTRHCVACHGAAKPRGGLRLDTAAAALQGGDSGPAVLPGRGDESPLIAAVRGDGDTERMPFERPPLSEAEIALLKNWIDQGAKSIAGEKPGVPPSQKHWAFILPRRPPVPNVAKSGWARNPIDRFVLARLERAGLAPAPEADRTTLLRRLSLDLIGLPPDPAEVDAFLASETAGAIQRTAERLLASPHFGERWARPWLDVARYADSNGYNIDAPRSIWKYRDWVIAALNADMPFDQFATDQLAGDLRPGNPLSPRIATGFHRNTPINQEGGIDVEQFRVDAIADRVNTTGTAFLGLTIGCCQCHDHKYDPITQREYYRLFAFFNNVDEPDLEIATPEESATRREVRARIDELHHLLVKRHPDLDEHERKWEATLTLEFTQAQEADVRMAFDLPRDKRSPSQRRALVELMMARDPAFQSENAELLKLRASEPKLVTTMVVRERSGARRPTHVHLGGDFTRKGELVKPGVPAVLPPLEDESLGNPADRMDLARWLVDRRNPLAARVVVNRIWQAYFGRGLVETDNDFGTQGSPPSHPELLDWLACELMDSGWSRKAIHRLIVSSATYRQSSRSRPEGQAVDPDNRLLWRQARLRLEAELIRDAALSSSGLLTCAIGGPSVFPPQPEGVMTLGQMKRPWRPDTGPNRYRRGLYTYFWRATPHPFLTTFDAPGGVQSCTRRLRSNTPLQALTLLNDPAFVEIAQALAQRIISERPEPASDRQRLQYAVSLCLGRPPLDRELQLLETVLAQERAEGANLRTSTIGGVAASAPRDPCSPTAPWITVARVLLNLDEFVTRE
jgi:mono/diheme cytochrome c family protein